MVKKEPERLKHFDKKYDSDSNSESQSAANISKKMKISSSSVARKLVKFPEYFIPRNQLQSRRRGSNTVAVTQPKLAVPRDAIVADFWE
jgi:hypothetical protein